MTAAIDSTLATALLDARERCARQKLLTSARAGLSVRLPGQSRFLFLEPADSAPVCESWDDASMSAALHATVYRLRPDAGAVLTGGGKFCAALATFGGKIPVSFDEQARHLGRMREAAPTAAPPDLRIALRDGANTALVGGLPLCIGITCQRMVLNAELFEKCAQAYVLAAATGEPLSTLPWWVRRIAIGRLRKDQRRAQQRFAQGLLPEESRGY